MSKSKKTALCSSLICIFMLLIPSAQAAMVSTSEFSADSNRIKLHEKLERDDVQQQLIKMGVDPESAMKRVDHMSNEEIAKLNGQIEVLPAGAGLSTIDLLLIIIIILLI